jgi:hypothetical protein
VLPCNRTGFDQTQRERASKAPERGVDVRKWTDDPKSLRLSHGPTRRSRARSEDRQGATFTDVATEQIFQLILRGGSPRSSPLALPAIGTVGRLVAGRKRKIVTPLALSEGGTRTTAAGRSPARHYGEDLSVVTRLAILRHIWGVCRRGGNRNCTRARKAAFGPF